MKAMIDSEVSERIKYSYDEENDESNIDINADNVNIPGTLGVGYISSNGSIYTDGRMQCNKLSIKNSANDYIVEMYVAGSLEYLKGRQLANNQLYYHCVKLTSATKTVYVNIYSNYGTAIDQIIKFTSAIKGNKNNNQLDWYYGAGDHVVHCYWDTTATSDWLKCFIDDERVTKFEDHTNGIFGNTEVVK